MNAVTVIEQDHTPSLTLPTDLPFERWLSIGRDLIQRDRETKWQAADWYAYGRTRAKADPEFAQQMELALPAILEDPKRLEAIAKVAESFPAEDRSTDLSFDHYAALSRLPHGEARKLLDKATRDRTPARDLRYEALGQQRSLSRLEPNQDDLLSSFIRHWNRLPFATRLEAAEMIAASGGEEIEP
ncbi:hypothetical protein [Pelagerythrobacter aerophilus]|uniref:Uncharacterized protein n=1 Tax=Pelagerythrobacter aerophilus TaxID=2306995 RepID=A0A418NK56_9SPHN|nr:hypothetical protein [Pelagerythrobacter aerophilus]RIV79559.1 hypothetical protein D2V04_06195 [Pelagerythrobacter aerophilus]